MVSRLAVAWRWRMDVSRRDERRAGGNFGGSESPILMITVIIP